jgi:alanyl-tRNA synthetase
VLDKLCVLVERNRQLEKELDQLKARAASAAGSDLASSALQINGIQVLAARLDGRDGKALLAMVDQLKNKLGSAVILLGGVLEDKVVLVAGVTADLTARYKAGELMRQAAAIVGGKGGGRPDMAQGGGIDSNRLDEALALTATFVEQGL